MIDREKVIKAIEYCTDDEFPCRDDSCPYWHDGFSACRGNVMKDAMELLKEQERKQVKPGVEHSGGGITWWNVCGACKTAINPNDKYCHECGVSIDWRPDDGSAM